LSSNPPRFSILCWLQAKLDTQYGAHLLISIHDLMQEML